MSTQELIDAQFDRAVEIVQSLPKTATVGNVQGPRPGMLHMLDRAKWDAWAENKDLDRLEAKWLYVDALLKVLRKYSDRTIAKSLVEELESYSGDPGNLVMSSSFSQSRASGSSHSTDSARGQQAPFPHSQGVPPAPEEEEGGPIPPMVTSPSNRPPSSLSSNRYRTPLAGSLAILYLPLKRHSAFADQRPSSTPGASYSQQPFSPSSYAEFYRGNAPGSQGNMVYSGSGSHPAYRTSPLPPQSYGIPGQVRPPSRMSLEHAVENVQAHLAALTERLDSLQSSMAYQPAPSHLSRTGSRTFIPRRTPDGDAPIYDLGDLGLWSYVVQPVTRGIDILRDVATFLARDENRTPTTIIVRRLCLDVSFLLCVLAMIRMIWRRSGVRRQEVKAALGILWRAILGTKERIFVITCVDKSAIDKDSILGV
ncbi:hypothetical protein DL96DRAFT_1593698 [Flagelloscypha sp. PMI_526]|nr:hypothetical protein DL96DRAFT_1593698 [Flagelloscypha sp. PMI_526]